MGITAVWRLTNVKHIDHGRIDLVWLVCACFILKWAQLVLVCLTWPMTLALHWPICICIRRICPLPSGGLNYFKSGKKITQKIATRYLGLGVFFCLHQNQRENYDKYAIAKTVLSLNQRRIFWQIASCGWTETMGPITELSGFPPSFLRWQIRFGFPHPSQTRSTSSCQELANITRRKNREWEDNYIFRIQHKVSC